MPFNTSFSTSQGRALFAIVAGSCLLTYAGALMIRKDAAERYRNLAIQGAARGHDSRDAIMVNHRPAKNANVKGAQPSASKFV